MRQATHELLQFLEVERSLELSASAAQQGSNRSALPPHDVFVPACVAHTRKLTRTIDRAYSDTHLRTVLENECSLDKMFVSVETGFADHDACKRFAKLLSDARDAELKDGSVDGYVAFCEYYYDYKGKLEKSGHAEERTSKAEEGAKETAERVDTRAETHGSEEASATNHTKGSLDTNKTKETEAAATESAAATKSNSSKVIIRKSDGREATEEQHEGAAEEQQKRKDHAKQAKTGYVPSWALGLIGFGIMLFLLSTVIVYSRTSAQ